MCAPNSFSARSASSSVPVKAVKVHLAFAIADAALRPSPENKSDIKKDYIFWLKRTMGRKNIYSSPMVNHKII
jgi:hypothetical protein